MRKPELISISELSRELGVNKSKIAYYVSKGLLKPYATVGRMYLLDKKYALETLRKIEAGRGIGQSLQDLGGK